MYYVYCGSLFLSLKDFSFVPLVFALWQIQHPSQTFLLHRLLTLFMAILFLLPSNLPPRRSSKQRKKTSHGDGKTETAAAAAAAASAVTVPKNDYFRRVHLVIILRNSTARVPIFIPIFAPTSESFPLANTNSSSLVRLQREPALGNPVHRDDHNFHLITGVNVSFAGA